MRLSPVAAALLLGVAALLTGATPPGDGVPPGFGPDPQLPKPQISLVPTVEVCTATGWTGDARPHAAVGTAVNRFAGELSHPRWLYVLPNGDVLVAETSGPPRPEDNRGIKGWVVGQMMKKAGSAVPSANRIVLLRDSDGDGVADTHSVLLDGLNSPFGMALVGDTFYVANTDALIRFPYRDGDTRITAAATMVAPLPAGPINHHWTKSLIASRDGRLIVGVGSNSNAGENGLEQEVDRASLWEIDPATGNHRILASGLRNPVGLAWEPESGALWTAVNERDELGDDLVPDYMTAVRDGAFYGWPYSYFGANLDPRIKSQRLDLVATAVKPDYALGAHTASLGLAYSGENALPAYFQRGMFVGQHGSWNRRPRAGYKVIFVPFSNGKPSGPPLDVVTGFIADDGRAFGRPVGVAIDRHGALLVADDVGNAVWRITAATATARQ